MSAANKRKEETSHYFHQPGMTQVKRPKLESLVVDGAIDLKRYLRSEVSAKYGKSAPPKNNRERKKAGQNALRQLNYVCLQVPDLQQSLDNHVEVVISQEQLHQAAKHTKKRAIWGTKDYTCDTDLFTALIHQSYLPAAAADSSFSWPDVASQVRVIIKVNPSKASYRASYSNGISSRHWASKCYGCSYRVERCWVVTGSNVRH